MSFNETSADVDAARQCVLPLHPDLCNLTVVAVCPESVYEISYISSGWCKESLMRLALRESVGGASEDSVMAPSNCRAGCGTLSVPLTTMGQMLAYPNSWLSTASCEENVLTMTLRDASQKLRCASGRRICLLAS